MFPPSNDTPEPQPPDASPLTGVDKQPPFHDRRSTPLGCLALVMVAALWIGSISYMNPQAWYTSPTWNAENPPIPPGLLEAITREQRAVKRLSLRKGVRLHEYYDDLQERIVIVKQFSLGPEGCELTDAASRLPTPWTATVYNLAELDHQLDDLKCLRRIESIQIRPRSLTENTVDSIRRLPHSADLRLLIDDRKQYPSDEPDYHILAGMPFTSVVVSERPLTKPISQLLTSLPNLDTLMLRLFRDSSTDELWTDVARCERLSTLMCWYVNVSDVGIQSIATMPRLKRLQFVAVDLGNQGLALLPSTLELDLLTISHAPEFGDSSLAALQIDPVELTLNETGVTFLGKGRDWLLSRKRLKRVMVRDDNLSPDDAREINALGGPQIETTPSGELPRDGCVF
jgi:hypothetical protein